jgi:hypothetical protein
MGSPPENRKKKTTKDPAPDAVQEGEPVAGADPPRSGFGGGPRGGVRTKKKKKQKHKKRANGSERERRAFALPSPPRFL